MTGSSVVYALLTASLFRSGRGFVMCPRATKPLALRRGAVAVERRGGCRPGGRGSSDGLKATVMGDYGAEGPRNDNRDKRRRRGSGEAGWRSCVSGLQHPRLRGRIRASGDELVGVEVVGAGDIDTVGGDRAMSFALFSSACPAGDESAGSWHRGVSADESQRLRAEWLVGDAGPSSTPTQPWELRSLPSDEQFSRLNRGLLQLSATFGWCVTDAEAVELDGFNSQVLADASYLSPTEQHWVGVAIQVAYHAHQGQRRKSGEPYIVHPVAVMRILAGLRMDAETLIAGLLHDTVEDTRLTFEDIEAQFGSTVGKIVEGDTKLSKVPGRVSAFTASEYEMGAGGAAQQMSGDGAKQAENLRHLLISMSKDWRVLVVKLADRLHNMRTLGAMPEHKKVRIAQETMGVFVPLARRMGLWAIKTELEDRCFKTLHPEEYSRVSNLLGLRSASTGHTEKILNNERQRLEELLGRTPALEGRAASFRVTVGVKPAYTVWRSMTRNGGRLGNVLDCVQFKVAFSLHPKPGPDGVVRSSFENSERERTTCYRLLESLHGLLPPVNPPRVDDFIAVPKPNGYRALHSTVLLKGHAVEVQILTDEMDRVAQFGIAASQVAARSFSNPKNLPWLAELQTSAEACALGCGDTYSASVRDSLTRTQERRFVFDPQGKILDLAGNATMCDAARELHDSKTCRVAATYVNGRLVPLNRPLKNGDVVAILTAPFQPPKRIVAGATRRSAVVGEVPLHVHTGVWPWSMCAMPTVAEGGEPERLIEIDEIPYMTKGEQRLVREVELKHARLSMFAVLAWTAIETERVSGLGTLKANAVAVMNESPFAFLWSLTAHQAVRVVMVAGVLECGFLFLNKFQDGLEEQKARAKRPAKTDQEKAMKKRTNLLARERELHNGRLAMVGVACLSVQSILCGEDSLARLLGLF